MANRNHDLDRPIEEAALAEFLQNGYEKASLRKIAASAGVTVGAIYTRYRTKDSLFCALAEPLIRQVGCVFEEIRKQYYSGTEIFSPRHMTEAMQAESEAILHLLFDQYDRAVLLLCRSGGSSLEGFFDEVVQRKVSETESFFRNGAELPVSAEILKLLLTTQFYTYYQVIDGGYGLETARHILQVASVYHMGGWTTLFTAAEHKKQEDSHEI